MYNFNHVPCSPDGIDTKKVAKRIKNKFKRLNKNPLIFLLNKQLNTSSLTVIKLTEINDFVKLTEEDLKKKVFLGSYQLKLSKSYLGELLKNGFAYSPSSKYIKSLEESEFKSKLVRKELQLIAVEINSRHKRSKIKPKMSNTSKFKNMYKIFILYIPFMNNYKSIKCKFCYIKL